MTTLVVTELSRTPRVPHRATVTAYGRRDCEAYLEQAAVDRVSFQEMCDTVTREYPGCVHVGPAHVHVGWCIKQGYLSPYFAAYWASVKVARAPATRAAAPARTQAPTADVLYMDAAREGVAGVDFA